VRRRLAIVAMLLIVGASGAAAHDPSAYGGLFRSRDLGGTWLNADVGLFLNAALTVAVDPRDPNHLLLGTDLGLLRSRNGGRSWEPEAQGVIVGGVFAAVFAPDGRSAICVAPGGVFRLGSEGWRRARAPGGAAPARAVTFAGADRVYLLGRGGLFVSRDGGRTFGRTAEALPAEAEITALAVLPRRPVEGLLAVVAGRLMASEDGGDHWSGRDAGLARAAVDTVVIDPVVPGRVWVASADRLYVSDDAGASWRTVGGPLPEPGTNVRGVAADPETRILVVTTHRGLYRSEDGGRSWALKEGGLPVHLEAGPLVRAPGDPRILYVVFSLVPYLEAWRTAVEGGNLLARTDPVSLAGGLAFVLLLLIGGGLLARWLDRRRGGGARTVTPVSGGALRHDL
jgi:photosystem II stability/assembly factor-like uncharacterized protein